MFYGAYDVNDNGNDLSCFTTGGCEKLKVRELILKLEKLDQEQEIRYESYEFLGDFEIHSVDEREYDGDKYYCILEES